jgi:hypothetical protein
VEFTADIRREFARSHAAIMRSPDGEAKGIGISDKRSETRARGLVIFRAPQ